jgi:uncharacterized protein (UPF0210 family)
MKVRSLTVFSRISDWNSLENELSKYLNLIDVKAEGIEIWSKRVSLPPLPRGVEMRSLAKKLDKFWDKKVFISAFHLTSNDVRINLLPEVLETVPFAFSSILINEQENIELISKVLIEVNRLDPVLSTRISVDFNNDFILTPYFPSSSSYLNKEGFGIAMRYTDVLHLCVKEGLDKECVGRLFRKFQAIGEELAKGIPLKFQGVDFSLSPWMDESVLAIIEELNKNKLHSVGALNAINYVNSIISSAIWDYRLKSIGYNEVMLPVAEDNLLKKRVKEGEINLSNLISYTIACVAGLDMVALPEGSEKMLSKILNDLHVIYLVKRRAMGARMIITNLKPGDEIDLGMFGKVPVIAFK